MAKTQTARRSITSSPAYQRAQTQLAAARRRLSLMRRENKGGAHFMRAGAGAVGGGLSAAAAEAFLPIPFAAAAVGVAQVIAGIAVVKKGKLADALVASGSGAIACDVKELASMFLGDGLDDDSAETEEA